MGKRPNRGASTLRWFELPGVELAVQPLAAPSYVDSLQTKAAGRARAVSEGVRPTWTPGAGWTFDGIGMYLKTGFVPTTAMTFVVRASAIAASTNPIFGVASDDGAHTFRMFPNHPTFGRRYYQNDGSVFFEGGVTSGVFGIAGKQPYLNGYQETVAISPSSYSWSIGIPLGCLYYLTYQNFAASRMQTVLIAYRILTPAEMWLASLQMAHCELPQFSVWARQQNYWLPPSGGWQVAWAQGINAQIGVN